MNTNPESKVITILARSGDGKLLYSETLKNTSNIKSLDDVGSFIMCKLKWPKAVFCGYDRSTQQAIIVRDAIKHGAIDWRLDFDKISISAAFQATASSSIAIVAICYQEQTGLGCLDAISKIAEIAKILFFVIVATYYYFRPYNILRKKYEVSESFVNETISRNNAWNVGFISSEQFKYKTVIERSIMRKNGYKKRHNKWVRSGDSYFRFPDEIIRGE